MAHFSQCTKKITGGLQAWHRCHGDVPANQQMQICHLQWSRGQGRTRSWEREQNYEVLFCKMKVIQTMGSAQSGDKNAVVWSCRIYKFAEWALSVITLTFWSVMCCYVYATHTDHTAGGMGQDSVWPHRAICRTVSVWSCLVASGSCCSSFIRW